MTEPADLLVRGADAPELERLAGPHWGAYFKVLTPGMRPAGGRLGVNMMRLPPQHAGVPFHSHQREDEVFYIVAGRGVFRYGDEPLREVAAGDCISCPAGSGKAHQLANPFAEDLVYLAIGNHDPDEVCQYPDTGKVMVRSLGTVGRLQATEYMDGEGEKPRILELFEG